MFQFKILNLARYLYTSGWLIFTATKAILESQMSVRPSSKPLRPLRIAPIYHCAHCQLCLTTNNHQNYPSCGLFSQLLNFSTRFTKFELKTKSSNYSIVLFWQRRASGLQLAEYQCDWSCLSSSSVLSGVFRTFSWNFVQVGYNRKSKLNIFQNN